MMGFIRLGRNTVFKQVGYLEVLTQLEDQLTSEFDIDKRLEGVETGRSSFNLLLLVDDLKLLFILHKAALASPLKFSFFLGYNSLIKILVIT